MNRNKFEGCMYLLDHAKDRAYDIKESNKALVVAEQNFNQCVNEIFRYSASAKNSLLELVQDYISQEQEIVYLIGVENGACIQNKKPKTSDEEELLKNIMPRVKAIRQIHKFYNKAVKDLYEFLDEKFPQTEGIFKKNGDRIKSSIINYANHMQEITFMIGLEDGIKLQKSLESGTFAIGVIKEIYEQFEDEKEAAQLPS
jgi:hypothetical protein